MSNAEFLNSFIQRYPQKVLSTLLMDHTTGHNIIWADASYAAYGKGFGFNDPITLTPLLNRVTHQFTGIIQPRAFKTENNQSKRTRKHAEVFTPSWLVNRMNNALDREWFGHSDVFNTETENGRNWIETTEPITFPESAGKDWTAYVTSPRLEITCGEAPFLCSRYDTTTGKPIAVPRRIGILDRKLRVISEHAKSSDEWDKWALKALQSTYGYEYQGDNLLIARINMLETLSEHRQKRWSTKLSKAVVSKAARIISWNIWQMDGLTDMVPSNKPAIPKPNKLMTLFDNSELNNNSSSSEKNTADPRLSRIYDWQKNTTATFQSLKRQGGKGAMKKFYAVIGNPPYQEESVGEQKTFQKPIYNDFLDAAYKVSDRVEMVHPGRFLFNAGSTPKAWNRKMLADPHLTVLEYQADSKVFFPQQDIKGGVAVTYRDKQKQLGPIGVFTPYSELNRILKTVTQRTDFTGMDTIVVTRTAYRLTDQLHKDFPNAAQQLSKGHMYDMSTNIFDRLPEVFNDEKPNDSHRYIAICGRKGNARAKKWIRRDYVNDVSNLDSYKLFMSSGNGSGKYGEALTSPFVGNPNEGSTETFISIGCWKTANEARNASKYVASKFARALLDVLKSTQHLTPGTWRYVPLQDFTSNSDIDWSQSIHDIDQQLYRKYGLTDEEQKFIESHVKEMD